MARHEEDVGLQLFDARHLASQQVAARGEGLVHLGVRPRQQLLHKELRAKQARAQPEGPT